MSFTYEFEIRQTVIIKSDDFKVDQTDREWEVSDRDRALELVQMGYGEYDKKEIVLVQVGGGK